MSATTHEGHATEEEEVEKNDEPKHKEQLTLEGKEEQVQQAHLYGDLSAEV